MDGWPTQDTAIKLRRWATVTLAGVLLSLASAITHGAPTVALFAVDATATESGSTAEIRALLSEPAGAAGLDLAYSVAGSAASGTDYSPLPTTLRVAAGARSASLVIRPIADTQSEADESVEVRLNAGNGYNVGTPSTATVSISDLATAAGPVATVQASTAVTAEGQTDQPGRFSIALAGAAGTAPVTVFFRLDGAAADQDYSAPSYDRITVSPGQAATLAITALADTAREGTQTLRLTLLPGPGYSVGSAQGSAALSILDTTGGAGAGGAPQLLGSIDAQRQRSAGTNESTRLTARLLSRAGAPLAAVAVQWQLDAGGSAAGGALSEADAFTTIDGEAGVTLTTGADPAIYRVTVTATAATADGETSRQATFVVLAGLIDSTPADTPQAAIAAAMDTFCPQLAANAASLDATETALLARCTELIAAADVGNDAAVDAALRAIAPEETATQRSLDTRIAGRQLQNIGTRLAALRRGMRGFSAAGLAFTQDGERLSGEWLEALFNDARGGGAGDAIGSEDFEPMWRNERLGLFVTGTMGSGEKDTTARESGFDFDTAGITAGADYRYTERLVAGLAVGYANSGADLANDGGELDADGYSVSGYLTYFSSEHSYIDGVVSWGTNAYDTRRHIAYAIDASTIDKHASAATDSQQFSLNLGAGYEYLFNNGVSTELYGRIGYLDGSVDGYTERGADELDLQLDEQSFDSLVYAFGAKAVKAISLKRGVLLPQLSASWEHEDSDAHAISGRFVHDPFATAFEFASDTPDSDYFRVSAGLSALFAGGVSAFVSYETILGRRDYTESEWALGLRVTRRF